MIRCGSVQHFQISYDVFFRSIWLCSVCVLFIYAVCYIPVFCDWLSMDATHAAYINSTTRVKKPDVLEDTEIGVENVEHCRMPKNAVKIQIAPNIKNTVSCENLQESTDIYYVCFSSHNLK